MSDESDGDQKPRGLAAKLAILTTVLLAVAGLLKAAEVVIEASKPLICAVHTSFSGCPLASIPQDIRTALVGKYRVELGPGGGCGGAGTANSVPPERASIQLNNNDGTLTAINECQNKSPLVVFDRHRGQWFGGQGIVFVADGRNATIVEQRNGGNSWVRE